MAENPNRPTQPTAAADATVVQLQKTLKVSARVAAVMASATLPTKEEMREWFEDGRLPCSLSVQLIWEDVLVSLTQLDATVAHQREAITEEQQKQENAAQRIQEPRAQPAAFEEDEKSSSVRIQTLRAELEVFQKLDMAKLIHFLESAAEVEKELVRQLETQLEEDRQSLFALKEKESSPKLSLLLNAFGADARTIQALADLDSMDFMALREEELKKIMAKLPRDQQIVVFYTQERLIIGKLPFSKHDCALCDCKTAEEMVSFLKEKGLERVTADAIRHTGASGKGALLYLSFQELGLASSAERKALLKCYSDHRNK